MTCKSCGGEHAPGACPAVDHEMSYVPILETTDSSLLPVVESLLEGAEIPFFVQGEEALGVLPVGGYGAGAHMHGLGAIVHVPKDREQEARALLERLEEPDGSEE